MYRAKLKTLEKIFFKQYPIGYQSEEWQVHAKKHKLKVLSEFVLTHFDESAFSKPYVVFDDFIDLIKKSSLVSVFEKVNFKDIAKSFSSEEKQRFVFALHDFLYDDRVAGFNEQVMILKPFKLAKWPILTVLGAYLRSEDEVFIKPTTVKNIIHYFEPKGLEYTPKANYQFYEDYRQFMQQLILESSEELRTNTLQFSGFLMSTVN